MDERFIYEVRRKVSDKPRLTPIFESTHCIPERLYEYNSNLFICYNNVEETFEIHALDQENSYCATLPYKKLDARTLRWVWRNDVRVHGDNIFRRIEKSEEDYKKRKEREFKNWVEDVASETRSLFAKDAWLMGT